MSSIKILVVGGFIGRIQKSLEKISKLHAKQNFAFVLVVGDLFSLTDENDELGKLLNGAINIPLPIYFTAGHEKLPDLVIERLKQSDEICPNLTFLGRKGTFTTSDGARIVYLGGKQIQNEASLPKPLESWDSLYLSSDARGLQGAHSAHILITNQWPAYITQFSHIPIPNGVDPNAGIHSIAQLCSTLKPWYHFSSCPEGLWEREPFKHPEAYESLEHPAITRFKALPNVSAPTKEWMTAFVLDTARPPKAENPGKYPLSNPSDNSNTRKRPAPNGNEYSRYGDHDQNGYSKRPSKRSREAKDPNDCFMCLNKSGFKTHMVVSIGDESMITVLRGPLPLPSTFPQLSFSGHIMIIPYYHAADEQAHGQRHKDEVKAEFLEMTKYRNAVNDMVGSKSQGRLGTVCWEVNRTGIRHLHWQMIALPADQIRKGLVEAAFKILAEKRGYPSFQKCDSDQELKQRSEYFRIWIWTPTLNPVEVADQVGNGVSQDAGVSSSLFFNLPPDEQSFHIWFGREVLAGLLHLEDRVNWKTVVAGDESIQSAEEEQDANGMKQDFGEFDFAMQS